MLGLYKTSPERVAKQIGGIIDVCSTLIINDLKEPIFRKYPQFNKSLYLRLVVFFLYAAIWQINTIGYSPVRRRQLIDRLISNLKGLVKDEMITLKDYSISLDEQNKILKSIGTAEDNSNLILSLLTWTTELFNINKEVYNEIFTYLTTEISIGGPTQVPAIFTNITAIWVLEPMKGLVNESEFKNSVSPEFGYLTVGISSSLTEIFHCVNKNN